jgi:hypothetical protein
VEIIVIGKYDAFVMSRISIWLLLTACATLALGEGRAQDSVQIRAVCDASAPRLREFGTKRFVLLLTLDDRGRVETFKTGSPEGLRLEKTKAAVAAIRAMEFKPAEKDGHPVAVQIKNGF